MTENQKNQTNGRTYPDDTDESDRDNEENPGGKKLDEEELAKQIKKKKDDHSTVFIKIGEYEVSLESNESLEETADSAIETMLKAKMIAEEGTLPTKGVQ